MAMNWLDLSAYGLTMSLAKTAKKHYLVLRGQVHAHSAKLSSLKFMPVPDNDQVIVKIVNIDANEELSSYDRVSMNALKRVFENAVEVPYDRAIHYTDISNAAAAKGAPAKTDSEAVPEGNKRLIGHNRAGQEVWDADNGRFVNSKGKYMAEKDSGGRSDGLFLRARSPESLAACCDGFVDTCGKSKVMRAEDFNNFIAAIYDGAVAKDGPEVDAARRAVEAAAARYLVRSGGNSQSQAFVTANRINENLAFMNGKRRPTDVGMVAPLAIAAQRLLGTEAALKGKKVVVVNPGCGTVISHLPRSMDLSLAGRVSEFEIGMMMSATGLKGEIVGEDSTDRLSSDGQIADLPRSVGPAVKTPAGSFKRKDLAAAIGLLDSRLEDGVTVLVLDPPTSAAEKSEFDLFREYVSMRYAFDGECLVDGSLCTGDAKSPGKAVMSISWRRPRLMEEALPPVVREVREWSSLWTWSAEVVTTRPQIERSAQGDEAVELLSGDVKKRNEYQVPYVSASRLAPPRTMVPRNLEGATRIALARVVRKHGDIDAFVAREFGYSNEELGEIFSAEQIDALALYIDAEARNRAFLVADQMGIGKGRTLAAIMRRQVLNGKRVLFNTEKQTNLSDIWRDIVHTRSEHLFKPMIVNDGVSIIDEKTKEVVLRSAPREEVDSMLESGHWPEGVNAIFSTYSQYSNEVSAEQRLVIEGGGKGVDVLADARKMKAKLDAEKAARDLSSGRKAKSRAAPAAAEDAEEERSRNAKARWILSAVDKSVHVVLDECHNAASIDSNISQNMAITVEGAANVTYSSATFAHKAKHMAFYSRLLPPEINSAEMGEMLEKGGETFQEVLAGMLVQDGVMVRREFDLSKVTYQTVLDSERMDRNCAYMDAIAPILTEIATLATEVESYVAAANGAMTGDDLRRNKIRRAGYGSPLYTVSRLFVAALKVDRCVELALESLQNNEKPVIVVENTVESLLEEVGDGDNDGTTSPDFKVLFNRILTQTACVRKVSDDRTARRDISTTDAAIGARVAVIRDMIDRIPHLPISAIDEVKSRIAAAGWTIGEITGRGLEVRDGKVMRRAIPNAVVEKNKFNCGEYDGILINTSGSTGIDLHASVRFEDQRPRHMIELQSPTDILRKVQTWGRINRYDQVHDPKITQILTGLPVEMRLAAMENAKLRRLSASTTSNREAAQLTRGIPDLINPVGDIVCARYAESHPDLIRKLGMRTIDVQQAADRNVEEEANVDADLRHRIESKARFVDSAREGEEERARRDREARSSLVQDDRRTANDLLARLIMLPVALQQKVCTELTAEFYAAVEELEAKGETPLKTHEMEAIVHPRVGADGKPILSAFEGAEVENPDSVFNEPLYLQDVTLERTGTPVKSDALLQLVEIGEMASGRLRPCVDRLKGGMTEILEPYLPDSHPTVEAAIAGGCKPILKRKAMLERLIATLGELKPGSEVTYTIDEAPVTGVVTRISYPDRGYEHIPGQYGIEFVVPGDEKARSMRLETLLRDPGFAVGEGLGAENYDALLKRFDDSVLRKLSQAKMFTNNIYRGMRLAVMHKLGSLRIYRMPDGTVHRGILVSNRFSALRTLPVEIPSAEMACDALTHGIELTADPRLADKLLVFRQTGKQVIEARLPGRKSKKYGFIYDEPRIASIARRDAEVGREGGSGRFIMSPTEMRETMAALHRVGVRFWCNSMNRQWAVDWLTSHNQSALVTMDEPTIDEEALLTP